MNKELIFGIESKTEENKLFVSELDFEIPHGNDYENSIQHLNFLQNSYIDDKQFLKLFEYNDYSLWWFIYPNLIPKLKKFINFIIKFSKLVDEYQPTKISINENFQFADIIIQISEKRNIPLNYSMLSLQKFQLKSNLKQKLKKIKYEKVTKQKINKRIKLNKNPSPNLLNKIIFATPTVYRRNMTNYFSESDYRGDHLQDNIMNMINSELDILGIDLDYTFSGDFEILAERLSEKINWIPFEILIDFKKNDSHTKFLKNYEIIVNDKKFQNLFHYNDVNIWNSLSNFFNELLFFPFLPYYLKILDSLTEKLSLTPPKVIFLPYETGPFALAIILASEKAGVNTIGIQHGYIYPGNPMYHYYNFRTKKSLLGFPIPSNFLVYGNYVKKLLIDVGYPEKNIITFGNPNFFELRKTHSILKEKCISEKYGIPKNKKIILFATGKLQPFYSNHGTYNYDVQIFKNLLSNFKNNSDVFIILKPHPTEKNISIYKNLINEFSVSNAKIIDGDLLEILSISSVTISVFSSVMIDSLCMNVPVVRVKFPNDENVIFDNSDSIVTVKINFLNEKILELFQSNELRNSLLENSKKFIKFHYGIPEDKPENIINNILNLN